MCPALCPRLRPAAAFQPVAHAVALGAALLLGGCLGRTDVSTGPDQAKNLPSKPHYTPQQYPSPSTLQAVREPTPSNQGSKHSGQYSHQKPGPHTSTHALPVVPPPDAAQAQVPDGYKVEVLMSGLTYPTSAEFDPDGNLFVAEAGYAYGDPTAKPRIIRVTTAGKVEVVAEKGLHGPVNDLLWHEGRMYVSHRGRISVLEGESVRDLVTGLPSDGDHHNNQLAAGPDGKIYFGQGTATNSGVVGLDNYKMGWLKDHPNFHDQPAHDMELAGREFVTPDPLQRGNQQVSTSAYHPFGQKIPGSTRVPGQMKAGGTILRMNPDGSELKVYAWGLRNPYGVMWGPDGKLYATENGFDVRGSRPVANDQEDVYVISEGAFYGWPDYGSGVPVTDPRFKPQDKPQPQFLMADHPPVEKPLLTFPKHAAITKIDFSPSDAFGRGQMFIAFFGHMTPMTGTPPQEHGGHRVVRVDPQTKKVETFFTKKGHHAGGGHTGHSESGGDSGQQGHGSGGHGGEEESVTPGPRRLVDVRFSPTGDALYVVDFGSMVVADEPKPIRGTGVIWRIVPEGSEASGPPAGLSATTQPAK